MAHRFKGRFIEMPFCFTGMGIFRVWTETVYANGSVTFPTQMTPYTGFAAFNVVAVVILLAMALAAHRIAPLYGKKFAVPLTGACLIASACANFFTILYPETAGFLGVPAMVLGAAGIALIILLWSELFGCLNPFRVGLYYAGGVIVGSLMLWLLKGLALPWLWVCTCLVPIISLECLRRSYRLLPKNERPHVGWGSFSLPWKPIAVVALYSLTYGLNVTTLNGFFGIHSGIGAVFAAAIVYVGICVKRSGFQFSFVYKLALPLAVLSLLPFASLGVFGSEITGFCALASYTLCLIVIMVILASITYRYGVNAIWLFGLERAVRLLAVQSGIAIHEAAGSWSSSTPIDVILALVMGGSVLVATLLLLSERQLTSSWGAVLKELPPDDRTAYAEKNRLGMKCYELSERYGLTQREEEILLMLAQGKKPASIEQELFVANSTVKTHTKHIYQKLNVHSRSEMFQLLGIESS